MNIEIAFTKDIRFGFKLFYMASWRVFFLIAIILPYLHFDIAFSKEENRIYFHCRGKEYLKEWRNK